MEQSTISAQTTKPERTGVPTALPGVRSLLRHTWVIYRQHYRLFTGVILLPLILATLASLTIPTVKNDAVLFVSLAVLSLLNFLISVTSDVALLYAIRERDKNATFMDAYRNTFRNFGPLVLVALLYTCVIAGGTGFFLIPGILLSITLSFSMYAAVNEDVRGFTALFRSRTYVRGRWSQIFLRMLILILLLVPIYVALLIIQELIVNSWLYVALNFAFSLFVIPLTTLYTYVLYTEAKQLYEQSGAAMPATPRTSYILLAVFGVLIILTLFLLPFLQSVATPPAV